MSFLKKLFSKKEQKQEEDRGINLGESVYPILKTATDPLLQIGKNTDQALSTYEIAEDLRLLIGLDVGDQFQYLKQSDLEKFGFSQRDLINAAYHNIGPRLQQELKVGQSRFSQGEHMFYEFLFDPNHLGALILMDEVWKQMALDKLKLKAVVAAMPAKNILMFSDLFDLPSTVNMYQTNKLVYEASKEDNIEFSENLYIRLGANNWKIYDMPNVDHTQLLRELDIDPSDFPSDFGQWAN